MRHSGLSCVSRRPPAPLAARSCPRRPRFGPKRGENCRNRRSETKDLCRQNKPCKRLPNQKAKRFPGERAPVCNGERERGFLRGQGSQRHGGVRGAGTAGTSFGRTRLELPQGCLEQTRYVLVRRLPLRLCCGAWAWVGGAFRQVQQPSNRKSF